MKRLKIILSLTLATIAVPALADDDHSLMSPQLQNYIGYGVILAALVLFIAVMLFLLRTFKILTRVILKFEGKTEAQIDAELAPVKKATPAKPKGEVWQKLLSLKPMAAEESLLMEDEYDGIRELDNPIPAWFMYLFYATIAFAVCYLLIYQVFRLAPLQYEEYRQEMAQAAVAQKAYLSKAANRVDESSVKLTTDKAVLTEGATIFSQNCTPCHGAHAQGIIGPNLTDDYWLHGGKINQVFKTIKYGVPTTAMQSWEGHLMPKQIAAVANYVKSLHGTNPPGAKAPQGLKEMD
jgi:cytochrome c oxidase cbb3-type subunit 3